jgi:hypothetical protein
MIRQLQDDPFLDDNKVLGALHQARAAASARAAATHQRLVVWKDGQLLTTDAVITELKERGKGHDDHGHGMDD